MTAAALDIVNQQARRAAVATVARDGAIRRALHDGHSLRTVAEQAGLSHTAVAKIRDRQHPTPYR